MNETWAVIHSKSVISPWFGRSLSRIGDDLWVLVVGSRLIDDDDVDVEIVDRCESKFELSIKLINFDGSFNCWRISIAFGRLNKQNSFRFFVPTTFVNLIETFRTVQHKNFVRLNMFDINDRMTFDSAKNSCNKQTKIFEFDERNLLKVTKVYRQYWQ